MSLLQPIQVNPNELTEQEAFAFLESLFPGGLKDAGLIAELCPDAPYDPSAALQQEAEHKARAEKTAKMRRQLEHDAQSAKRKARTGPPPTTVQAYQNIFHRFPPGWPPDPYTPD